MARWVNRWARWPVAGAYAGVLLLSALVGWVDYLTGTELRVFPLYFLPVSLIAWRGGLRPGLALALACALTWDISNRLAGVRYSHAVVGYANALALLVAFATVSLLVSALREEVERQRALARVDPLTGLFNRRAFYENAEQELRRARRYGHPLSLALLDLDDFKAVNDSRGHHIGDDLLQAVAVAIRAASRDTDVAARLGGDEFVVLLPETQQQEAEAAVAKLRERLVAALQTGGWPVTASTGVVSYRVPPAGIDDMMRRADALMYAVKADRKGGLRLEIV